MRGFKRTRASAAPEGPGSSTAGSATCYLTRGSAADEWHLWNTSARALNLRVGDELRARVVDRAFGSDASLLVEALSKLTVRGSSSEACVLGRDVRFRRDPSRGAERTPGSSVSHEAISQADLLRTCASKGVECSLFLEHCAGNGADDEELRLGSATRSLFVASVKEMLSRKYDIMHHYALFDRALGLYYSSEARSAPPGAREMTEPGGWLDRSAEEHAALHGVHLVGADHASFSRWNYPVVEASTEAPRGDDANAEGPARSDERGGGDESEEGPARSSDKGAEDESEEGPARSDERGRDGGGDDDGSSPVALSGETNWGRTLAQEHAPVTERTRATKRGSDGGKERGDEDAAKPVPCGNYIYHAFNNLSGTLTDGPKAFPYAFAVRTSGEVSFNDLVNYCLNCTSPPVGPLPARERWGSINPVLLMEDPVDPETGRVARRYTVTSRGYLSSLASNPDRGNSSDAPCYNEVFLPGRPVSRLNLDVDLKCCLGCSARFSARADHSTKALVSRALVSSVVMAIAESLLRLAKVKRSELDGGPGDLANLGDSVGKIAAYQRTVASKPKLSMRLLWYLPTELCSFD